MTYARLRFDLGSHFLRQSAVSPTTATFTLVLAVVLLAASRVAAEPAPPALETRAVQDLVDELRGRLAIPHKVHVTLVDHDPLVASVTRDAKRPNTFTLSIERAFAQTLTDDELRAVVAHELGHVWIFTHHPFLQTESLANHVALRVVERARLEAVYEKVWQRVGEKSTLARFMSPSTPAQQAGLAHSAVEPVRTPAAAPRQNEQKD